MTVVIISFGVAGLIKHNLKHINTGNMKKTIIVKYHDKRVQYWKRIIYQLQKELKLLWNYSILRLRLPHPFPCPAIANSLTRKHPPSL